MRFLLDLVKNDYLRLADLIKARRSISPIDTTRTLRNNKIRRRSGNAPKRLNGYFMLRIS